MGDELELINSSYSLTHKEYMPNVFIAPTEPDALKELGLVTMMPEHHGVDIMWESVLGRIGIQRKVFPDDFLASVHDGRLNKEYQQMQALDIAFLLLEGREHWTTHGTLIRGGGGKRYAWSRAQHRNYLASVQLRGVKLLCSDDLADTVRLVDGLRVWSDKDEHGSLDVRPGPRGDLWGQVTNEDYQRHILQGVPGVGPKQAAALISHLGFPLCLRDGITEEKLMEVPGIGKKKAVALTTLFKR